MKKLAKPIRWLANIVRGGRASKEAGEQRLTAYCAECGGQTLIQRRTDLRVYCPQCDR